MFKFRVAMQDIINGKRFTFACLYNAANGNAAGKLAMREWPNTIILEIKRRAR